MFLLSRLLVYLTSSLIFLIFISLFLSHKHFIVWLVLAIAAIVFAILSILKKKTDKINKILFLTTPVLFILASMAASIFLNNSYIKLLFSGFAGFIIFLYLENLFLYFYVPSKYNIYSLENISGYINLIIVFFASFSSYGLKTSFGINIYRISGLVAINLMIMAALIHQTLWINKINFRETKNYMLITVFLLAQIYLIIFFLPSSFYVNGLIFSLAYYVIVSLIKYKLLNKLEKRVIIQYVLTGTLLFSALLLTTKWA